MPDQLPAIGEGTIVDKANGVLEAEPAPSLGGAVPIYSQSQDHALLGLTGAASLSISIRTTEGHKYEIMEALGAKTSAELVQHAIRLRLIAV
jgi:hypothetical protein